MVRLTGGAKPSDMYTVVVGGSHYRGGRTACRSPVSFIQDRSVDMLKRHALSAAKSEMHGRMLGNMAEEYHLYLLT